MTGNGSATAAEVAALRQFNRFYTRTIGVVQDRILGSAFTLAEARVLYEIAHREAPSARVIATDLGLDEGYMSRIVRGFERRGFVARKRARDDARRRQLHFTERGSRALAPLERRADAEAVRILERLSQSERVRLVAAMRTLGALLGEAASSAAGTVIRRHRPGDFGWIVSRHSALYAEEFGWSADIEALAAEVAARFIRKHDPAREACWIAEAAGERLGAVALVRRSARVAQLRLLIVEPAARGHGIGARLVNECVAFARSAGYRKLALWTNDVLHAARRLYERAGFELVAETPHHEFGPPMVGQNWELELGIAEATARARRR